MYVFQLFDYYAGSKIILLIAFFEVVVVSWIYGEYLVEFQRGKYMQASRQQPCFQGNIQFWSFVITHVSSSGFTRD